MGKILDPKVKVDKIEIDIGKDLPEQAESLIKNYGNFVPLLKIKDELINSGDIIYYWYSVDYNNLPVFIIKINDSFNRFKSLFNDDEIIKGVAFIGNKNWYHKANILINDTVNDNNGVLTLYGIFFNEKLYNSVQSSYNEKSLIDIYTDICTKTDLGLYLIENDKLTNNLPLILNPNISYLNLINDLITKYTQNNFWCIDNYYILHLQNYDTLIKKETDKYSMKDNIDVTEPLPVIITNYPNPENKIEVDEKKFVAYDITINNNVGLNMINLSKSYSINNENITSHEKIGLGSSSANTFSKFQKNSFPFYNEIFNKEISGNIFELKMQTPLYEIFPFMVVETEIYHLSETEKERKYILNEKQSGKKIVMGYEFEYSKINSQSGGLVSKPEIVQTIKLI